MRTSRGGVTSALVMYSCSIFLDWTLFDMLRSDCRGSAAKE